MIRTSLLAAASAIAFAALAPAHAQDAPPTIRVDSGTVMPSDGGEFVSAASGSQVTPGRRVMLAEGSSAALGYPNGCTATISAAGVHAVPAVCQAGAAQAGAGQSAVGAGTAAGGDWASAGWLFLGTAAVGAGLASMDTEPAPPEYIPPPVSR